MLSYKNDVKPTQNIEVKPIDNHDLYFPVVDGTPTEGNLPLTHFKDAINYYLLTFYRENPVYEPVYEMISKNYSQLFNFQEEEMNVDKNTFKNSSKGDIIETIKGKREKELD